jgi:hypothetical protein
MDPAAAMRERECDIIQRADQTAGTALNTLLVKNLNGIFFNWIPGKNAGRANGKARFVPAFFTLIRLCYDDMLPIVIRSEIYQTDFGINSGH